MTTWENILYGPRARGELNAQALEFAEFLLNKVGLREFRHKYPTQLSGGMQRRAELARAMINNPQIMILDEPFRGLDAMTKELMWEYYANLYEESGRTNFFVTTDIDEAVFLADRMLIMTNIPTQVRAVIEVDVPRPRRRLADMTSDRANAVDGSPAILHGGDEVLLARQQGGRRLREAYARARRRPGWTGSGARGDRGPRHRGRGLSALAIWLRHSGPGRMVRPDAASYLFIE
jgi:ABC-type taurine transport system ATPase subunit